MRSCLIVPTDNVRRVEQKKDGGEREDTFPSWGLVLHADKSRWGRKQMEVASMRTIVRAFDVCRTSIMMCVLVALHGRAPAQEYEIKLDRPEETGNRYSVSLKGTRKGWMAFQKREGRPLPPYCRGRRQLGVDAAIELDAAVEVMRVDERRHVYKKALSVRRWRLKGAENAFGLDPTSKLISAKTVNGKAKFRLDGERLGTDEYEVLDERRQDNRREIGIF